MSTNAPAAAVPAQGDTKFWDACGFIFTANHRTLRPHWLSIGDHRAIVRVFPPVADVPGGTWWRVSFPNGNHGDYPSEWLAFETAVAVSRKY